MNNFKFKSLAFYGATIAGVLILFKTVSAYGETNLKAPPVINGRYRLALVENLPNCVQLDLPILNLQQSGIYVNASLLPVNTSSEKVSSNQKNHSLSGILKNQQLTLSGKIDSSLLCNITSTQNAPIHSTTMQMQLLDKGEFTGQLTVSGISQNLKFTAIPQKEMEKSQPSKSH